MSCRHEDLVLLYFIDYYYVVKPSLFCSFVVVFFCLYVPLFSLLFCLWNYGLNLMLHDVATLGHRPQRQMIMTSDDSDVFFSFAKCDASTAFPFLTH